MKMNTLSETVIRNTHPTAADAAFARRFSLPLPCCLLPVAVPGLMELLARNLAPRPARAILVRAE
jgi:hypothetical protein